MHLVEVSGREPNEQFLIKLEGIGFGFLIPIFFISVGVGFNLKDLLNHPSALVKVPLFLVALLVVRGVPALLYKRVMDTRHAAAAGLLQATTLTLVIVAVAIGRETGKLSRAWAPRWSPLGCCPRRCSRPGRTGYSLMAVKPRRRGVGTGHSSARPTYLSKRAKSARFIVTTVPTP